MNSPTPLGSRTAMKRKGSVQHKSEENRCRSMFVGILSQYVHSISGDCFKLCNWESWRKNAAVELTAPRENLSSRFLQLRWRLTAEKSPSECTLHVESDAYSYRDRKSIEKRQDFLPSAPSLPSWTVSRPCHYTHLYTTLKWNACQRVEVDL